jgi:hypothetical protein
MPNVQPERPKGDNATRRESAAQAQEAEALLVPMLAEIDRLVELSNQGYFKVDDDSSLGLDNRVLRPLTLSSSAQMGIVSAIDHLRTVAIIVRAGSLPYVALFSLLRSAIETSSVAIYLLEHDARAVRARRLLVAEYQEIADRVNSQANMGEPPVDRPAAEALIRRSLAGFPAAGSWADVTKTTTPITTKVKAASALVEAFKQAGRPATAIVGMWQVFSGATHARGYAIQTVLERTEVGYDPETGIVDVLFTTGARSLLGSLKITVDVVETALHLYGKRARSITNQLEDTELSQQLKADDA